MELKDKEIFCFLHIAKKEGNVSFQPTFFWRAQEQYEGCLFLASAPENGPFNLLTSAQLRRMLPAGNQLWGGLTGRRGTSMKMLLPVNSSCWKTRNWVPACPLSGTITLITHIDGCWVLSSPSKILSFHTRPVWKKAFAQVPSLSLFLDMLPDAAGWLSEGTSKTFQRCLTDLRANWYKPTHVPAATPGSEDLGRNCLLLHAFDAPWRKWLGLYQHWAPQQATSDASVLESNRVGIKLMEPSLQLCTIPTAWTHPLLLLYNPWQKG